MSAAFKFDTSRFDRSLKAFAAESRKSGMEVLENQARLFVRDVASVTPPNKDARFLKGRGVSAVKRDISKVMRPVRMAKNDPAAIHGRFRGNRGRVVWDLRGKKPDRRFAVSKPRLDAHTKKTADRVGFLAAGWVAAGRKFGTRLPEWITRHGSRYGNVRVGISRAGISIRMVNSVSYAGNVAGMTRRVQWALDNRARQMTKQLEDLAVKRAAGKAGLKTR